LSAPAKIVGIQALILSGGGAQAAYEVGVMSGLLTGQSPATDYSPLDPAILIGTSAGSINAGLFLSSARAGAAEATNFMEQVWTEDMVTAPGKCGGGVYRLRAGARNAACLFSHPWNSFANIADDSGVLARTALTRGINFLMSGGAPEQRALELVDLSALISIEPFVKLIHKRILLSEIRQSSSTLKIAATNWRTGEARIFDKLEMSDSIGYQILQASSALPGVFPPVEIEGDPYVDGGLVMNTPLKPAIDAGADTLHIICMDPDMSRVPLPRMPATAAVFSRSLEINFRTAMSQDIRYAAEVNHAIAVLQERKPLSDTTVRGGRHLLRETLKRITNPETKAAHRSLTMHLYYPSGGLNVGWLSFERDSIVRLIRRGREDAIHHDCVANRCVLPFP
jgi:predicted acylesterase/phospholipase RssA